MSQHDLSHHTQSDTILDYLAKWAEETPDALAFTFLSESEGPTSFTYAQLWFRVQTNAAFLQHRCKKNEPVILCFAPGLTFIETFFACLLVGVIAIPLYPPKANQKRARIDGVIADSGAQYVLCDETSFSAVKRGLKNFIDDELIALELMPKQDDHSNLITLSETNEIAFLQYTSGSTGMPKGVMVSHTNIVANLQLLIERTGANQTDVFVNWLPLFHDLGLINTLLLPVYLGSHSVLMAPAQFLQKPATWLQAITDFRGTICGAPNFAYDHCVQKMSLELRDQIDLSSWRIAFNAAEPIKPGTLGDFIRLFEPAGFNPHAFFPSYGMAEATVFICGESFDHQSIASFSTQALRKGWVSIAQDAHDATPLVACGVSGANHFVHIVNPETGAICAEDEIGEIWCAGPSIARGYWNAPLATQHTFKNTLPNSTAFYLRTGDLGFIYNGSLYISGRQKDVLILNGQNVFPQDIEWLVIECDPIIDRLSCVAFMLDTKDAAKVAVAFETTRTGLRQLNDPNNVERIANNIRQQVAVELELAIDLVIFLPPGQLPKTSSGKVQRAQTKALFSSDQLKIAALSNLARLPQAASKDTDIHHDLPEENQLALIWSRVLGRQLSVKALRASSFFAEGGDSIKITQLAVELGREFQWPVTLTELFHYLQFSEQVAWIKNKCIQNASCQHNSMDDNILVETSVEQCAISAAQQRLWFLHQIVPDNSMLNISVELVLTGDLAIEQFERAWELSVKQHSVLLAGFVQVDDAIHLRRAVYPSGPPLFYPLSNTMAAQQELQRVRTLHSEHTFELLSEPSYFSHLIQVNTHSYHLLFTVHHIVADAWSFEVFLQDLSTSYRQLTQPHDGVTLTSNGPDYVDYAVWSVHQKASQQQRDFWQAKLAGIPRALGLPYDFRKPVQKTYAGSVLTKAFGLTHAKVKYFAAQHAVTPFAIYLAAYNLMLSRITGQKDIVIGTDVANRERGEVQKIFGFFVNQLAIRVAFKKDCSVLEWINVCQQEIAAALSHQSLPFEHVVESLGLQGQLDTSPVFQCKLLLNQSPLAAFHLPQVNVQQRKTPVRHAQYDMTLAIDIEADNNVDLNCHFDSARFSENSIDEFMKMFTHLLDQLMAQPEVDLSQLNYLTDSQLAWLTQHETGPLKHNSQKLHAGMEAYALAHPHYVGCIAGAQQYTYQTINQRVNQLAHLLLAIGGKNVVIGIALPSGYELLCSLLAVLKIGGTFVPLDPNYPDERLRYMLEDSEVSILIGWSDTLEVYADLFVGTSLSLEDCESVIDNQSVANPECDVASNDLAYILYTSGSTGRPKGVRVSYGALENLCNWYKDFCTMNEKDVVLHLIPFGFDASIKNFLTPMMCGAQLLLPEMKAFDAQQVVKHIKNHQVSITNCIPSVFEAILAVASSDNYQCITSFKFIALGGERLDLHKFKSWIGSAAFNATIANIYGPTECTDIAVAFQLSAQQLQELVTTNNIDSYVVPIGAPIYNTQVKVLTINDEELLQVPPGSIGELMIAGQGLANGYVDRVQTNAAFINLPINQTTYYRTGDLVKWDSTGNLIYLGRLDEQIKINGIRIELAEIEACLIETGHFAHAVVLKKEQQLVAYLQARNFTPPTDQQLKSRLRTQLPTVAVPHIFIYLSKFPKLPNGKLDKNQLDKIPLPQLNRAVAVVPAATPEELVLAACVCELLRHEEVSMGDNFFELGGDSILSVQLVSLLQHQGFELAVVDIFETADFTELAQRLTPADTAVAEQSQEFDFISAEDLALLNQ